MPSITLEQEAIAAANTVGLVSCIYTLLIYTNTARSPKPRSNIALRHWFLS